MKKKNSLETIVQKMYTVNEHDSLTSRWEKTQTGCKNMRLK